MILNVPLQTGTLLANVRYLWITNGVVGAAQTTGITQPDAVYPLFRIDVVPPDGAEELIAYDNSDIGNWNVANYAQALASAIVVVAPPVGYFNLAKLKAVVAAYHQKKVSDLTIGAVDLFLIAANSARKKAEQLHNFEMCRCSATLAIDGVTGGDLSTAVITDPLPSPFSGIREVVAIQGLRNNSEFVPVDFTRLDVAIERRREQVELNSPYAPGWRYPSDADVQDKPTRGAIVQRGSRLLPYPPSTITTNTPWTAYLEAYGWLSDYVDADLDSSNIDTTGPKDFFIQHGFSYMQWATIIELNFLFSTFVPRQEGNVGVPQDKMTEAWRDLVLWDSYQIDSHMTLGG